MLKNYEGSAEARHGDSEIDTSDVDVVILTILPQLELRVLLEECRSHWRNAKSLHFQGLDFFKLENQKGFPLTIAVKTTRRKGNLSAAIEISTLLERFKPSFAFLCGIAGNINPLKNSLGDVIISDSCNYQRYTRMSEGRKLEKSVDHASVVSDRMFNIFNREFNRSSSFELPGDAKFEFGKLFCWDMVLDCEISRAEIVAEDRDVRAVEMESAGFISAVEAYNQSRRVSVGSLVFRGLSDPASSKAGSDADPRNFREIAARNASKALLHLLNQLEKDDCRPYSN